MNDEGPNVLTCMDCGRIYGDKDWLDVNIPDAQWEAITGRSDGGGILCAACIVRRGQRLPKITYAFLEFRG